MNPIVAERPAGAMEEIRGGRARSRADRNGELPGQRPMAFNEGTAGQAGRATREAGAETGEHEPRPERLVEHVADWRTPEVEVDHATRVIRNVALAGPVSKNGYRYKTEALAAAVPLYDGRPVFLDHPPNPARPKERSTRDLAGTVVRPRFENDRLRADIAVVQTEAGRTLLALAESDPPGVGLSHVVLAERSADGALVERIHEVVSVDAVVFPATTDTFRERVRGQVAQVSGRTGIGEWGPPTDRRPQSQPLADTRPTTLDPSPNGLGQVEQRLDGLQRRIEALLEQIALVTHEREAYRQRAERNDAERRAAAWRREIERMAETIGLPRQAMTEPFVELLLACDDETQVKRYLDDRRRVVEQFAQRRASSLHEGNGNPAAGEGGSVDAALVRAIAGGR